jgi:predicted  nucleic acid-binding Zn-ribbon protein
MKDSRNFLLVLLSIGLLATWFYHLYDKSHYLARRVEVLVKDSMATQEAIRDSIQKLYNDKVFELDTTKVSSDSLRYRLDSSVSRIVALRNEIGSILRKNSITKYDLQRATNLITEYKRNLEDVKAENSDLESERDRLNGVLTQLNNEMKNLQDNIQKVTLENKDLTEAISQASIFIASDIHFSAITVKNPNKETETTSARKTDKFVFSFTLQNNVIKSSFYDLYVVITKPGRTVLQNDVWGGNVFTTKNEGARPYTTKIHFEYSKGERKNILYTLDPGDLEPGNYTLEVYQNGVLIAETNKTLG